MEISITKAKIIVISSIIFCAVLFAGILILKKKDMLPAMNSVSYEVDEPNYEFEPVIAGTEVKHDYIIKNTGDDTLKIIRVRPG